MYKYANKYSHSWPNNVVVHGATEPILTVLELGGFEIRDLFLIGFNPDCGSVIVDSEQRAREASAALEPAYATKVEVVDYGDWEVTYDRRDLDGSEPSRFITGVTLTDGTVVMKDGRRVGPEAGGR